jgi:hypothetical protein
MKETADPIIGNKFLPYSMASRQKMKIFNTVTTSFDKEATNKLPHDKYTLFWAYLQSFIKTYRYRVIYSLEITRVYSNKLR